MQQINKPKLSLWPFCTFLLIFGAYYEMFGWDGFLVTSVVLGSLNVLGNLANG